MVFLGLSEIARGWIEFALMSTKFQTRRSLREQASDRSRETAGFGSIEPSPDERHGAKTPSDVR